MPQYTAIVRELSREKFAEVFSASSRRAREAYFQRHSIRKPRKLTGLPKAGASSGVRVGQLHDVLKQRDDEDLVEEVLRTWLLTKRSMLAAALDHLEIPHEGGLTDSEDLARFEKLTVDELRHLVSKLTDAAPRDDVAIYLKFMGSENVDTAIADVPTSEMAPPLGEP